MLKQGQIESIRKVIDGIAQFDAAVVFGYGPVLSSIVPGTGKLNVFGKTSALAAGLLYQACTIPTIIPTGARTGGVDKPSEAQLIGQTLIRKFGVAQSAIALEEAATNTILNVVFVANMVDKSPQSYSKLLFVGMGFHLRRIRYICRLVGLKGQTVAAEAIVSNRTARHRVLLREILSPKNKDYMAALRDQERFLWCLKNRPDYWLPEMVLIENPARLSRTMHLRASQSYLRSNGITLDTTPMSEMRKFLCSIPRFIPHPDMIIPPDGA